MLCAGRARSVFSAGALLGAVACCVLLPAGRVRADLKIVAQVKTIKNGETQKPVTRTTYIQDEMVREDVFPAGAALIHDLTTDHYFYLDNVRKLCATLSGKGQSFRERPIEALISDNTAISGTATIKPGNKTKTIAGKVAKNYVYSARLKVAMRGNAQQFGILTVRGEMWAAPSVSVAPRIERMQDAALLRGMGALSRGMKPILAKLAQVKGYPLDHTYTMTLVSSDTDTGRQQETETVTTSVTEISGAPLDSSLFLVPSGYREIAGDPGELPDNVMFTIFN